MAAERSVRAYSRMAMSEGAQFILFCALQRMDAEVPNATQIGGPARVLIPVPIIRRDGSCLSVRSHSAARRNTANFSHRPHARTGPTEAADSSGHLLSRRGLPDGKR